MEEAVKSCYYCGALTFNPHYCRECGRYFCRDHRSLEQHECESLKQLNVVIKSKKPSPVSRIIRLLALLIIIGTTVYLLDMRGIIEIGTLIEMFRGYL